MAADDEESAQPRSRAWFWLKWIALSLFLVMACALAGLQWRNQQQWNRVNRFIRSVKAAGGRADTEAQFGTDFLRLGRADEGSLQRSFSWPGVYSVKLPSETRFEEIDWQLASELSIYALNVAHEFGDRDLAVIPPTTSIKVVNLFRPGLTDASIARLRAIPKLKTLNISHAHFTPGGLVRLLSGNGVKFSGRLTTEHLQALQQAGLVSQLAACELTASPEFRVEMLQGAQLRMSCAFRGEFHPDAFQDVAKFLPDLSLVKFKNAKISAQSLAELSRTKITDLILIDTEVTGEPPLLEPTRSGWILRGQDIASGVTGELPSLEPIPGPSEGQPVPGQPGSLPGVPGSLPGVPDEALLEPSGELLVVSLVDSKVSSSQLAALARREIQLTCIGNLADDAWVEEIMQKHPNVQWVKLWNAPVSEQVLAKYPYTEKGYRFAAKDTGPPNISGQDFFK